MHLRFGKEMKSASVNKTDQTKAACCILSVMSFIIQRDSERESYESLEIMAALEGIEENKVM